MGSRSVTRRFGLLSVAILGAAAALVWVEVYRQPAPMRVTTASMTAAPPAASLYCEFYNFMHSSTVVSFDFSADVANAAAPHFAELYVIEPDGTQTSFNGAPTVRPNWTFTIDDGTPTITSPDEATRIVLYGYRPKASGIVWTEAGIRSDTYKNLDGKCRQAYFGKTPN